MSLNAATIEILLAKGLSGEDILEVARATEVKADRTNADRQARHRAKRKSNAVTVTERDPKESNIQTLSSEPGGSKEVKPSRSKSSFSVPDWVPAEPWAAFETMRKAMRGVPFGDGAKQGIVADLEKLRGEGHDPTKLLLKAVKLGWRGVFGGDDTKSAFQRAAKPWTAADLRRAIAYAEDNNDPERAAEYRARLETIEQPRRATGPPGRSIGEIVQKAQLSH